MDKVKQILYILTLSIIVIIITRGNLSAIHDVSIVPLDITGQIFRDYDFGFVRTGDYGICRIKHDSTFVDIKTIYNSDSVNLVFKIDSKLNGIGKTFPWLKLLRKDYVSVTIKFSPKKTGYFSDTIHIIGKTDSNASDYSDFKQVIRGQSVLNLDSWTGNVSASFQEDSTVLQVYAKNSLPINFNHDTNNISFDYKFRMEINADLFYPIGCQGALIDKSEMRGNKLFIDISGKNLVMDGSPKIIAEVAGDLLFSNNLFSPVELSDFVFFYPNTSDTVKWLELKIKNGSLKAEGACSQGGIIRFMDNAPLIYITPMPVNDVAAVSINSTEDVPFDIEIHNLYGRRLLSELIAKSSGSNTSIRTQLIDMSLLSSGVYLLTVNTGFYHRTVLFNVCK